MFKLKELLINNILIKQYGTGGRKGSNDYLFKVWELPGNLKEETIEEIIEQSKKYNVDFILETKKEELEFLHVSYIHLQESIEEKGLIIQTQDDWISDLGTGLYVVEDGNEEALDNLKNYVEHHEDDELLLVRGSYQGEYLECIHGDEHVGYICIKENIKKEDVECEVYEVEDFLCF